MEKNKKINNLVIQDEFRKNISSVLIAALSADAIFETLSTSTSNIFDELFLNHTLLQLKWIAGQLENINRVTAPFLHKESREPLKLVLSASLFDIPSQIKQAQSALIRVRLNSVNGVTTDQDISQFATSMYVLRDELYGMHKSLSALQATLEMD